MPFLPLSAGPLGNPQIIGATIGAGANILGDVLTKQGAEKANETNAQLAREQMAFQERMSNTAWQRAVEDMRKAGLNPALAYEKGGASTPSGATATMQNANAAIKGSAAAAATLASDMANAAAMRRQADASVKKTEAETRQLNLESAERVRGLALTNLITSTNARHLDTSLLLGTQLQSADLQARQQDYRFAGESFNTRLRQIDQSLAATIAGIRESTARAVLSEIEQPRARTKNLLFEGADTLMRDVRPHLTAAYDWSKLFLTKKPQERR